MVGRKLRHTLRTVIDRPTGFHLLAAILLSIAASILSVVSPLALKELVDRLATGSPSGLLVFGVLYLAGMAFSRIAGVAQSYVYGLCDQALQRNISADMLARLLRLPMSFHSRQSVGGLLQIQTQALQGVRLLLSIACSTLLPLMFQVAIILAVVAGRFDTVVWLVVVAAMAGYAVAYSLGAQRANSVAHAALATQVEASRLFADGIANASVIKSFGAETLCSADYARSLRYSAIGWRDYFRARAATNLAAAIVFASSMACALWFGSASVLSGQISVGDFVLLCSYMLQIVAPLEAAGTASRDAAQGLAYLSSWVNIARLAPEDSVEGPKDSHAGLEGRPPAIRFEGVALIAENGRTIVSDLNFSIPAAATVALVGCSGAGKTSILRLIQKHCAPSCGSISIDGAPIAAISARSLRRRMSVVSSEPMLLDDTLRANLLLARPDADDEALQEAMRSACLEPLVAILPSGLDTLIGERGIQLSTGQRQRVAVARAILRDADILLLDEPTSALDIATEQTIWRELRKIAQGRTTLVVTHNLRLARDAHFIILLNDGLIGEQGSHTELIGKKGLYAKLWSESLDSHANSGGEISGGETTYLASC